MLLIASKKSMLIHGNIIYAGDGFSICMLSHGSMVFRAGMLDYAKMSITNDKLKKNWKCTLNWNVVKRRL